MTLAATSSGEYTNNWNNKESKSRGADYIDRSVNQLALGNYSDDATLLGTAAQVGMGLLNLDLPMDIRDLTYDLTNWEWTPGHVAQTLLDTVGLLPAIGSVKYIDEALRLLPFIDTLKYTDEFGEALGSMPELGRLARGVGNLGASADDIKEALRAAGEIDDVVDTARPLFHLIDDAAESTGDAIKLWGSTDNLINSATTAGKGGVSPVGRAFQKHAGNPNRAGTFVGDVSGNAAKNTEQGAKYVSDILSNPKSTYKTSHSYVFGDILDVRLPDGTGARWSADGKIFIMFLEKYTH